MPPTTEMKTEDGHIVDTQIKLKSPGVWVSEETHPAISAWHVKFLAYIAPSTPKGRARICIHKNETDRLHEMMIAFTAGNYVRPSRHTCDESLHILIGHGEYLFFDDKGEVEEVVPLGNGGQIYCRITAGRPHALVVRSPMVIHETALGPFDRSNTTFEAWSPKESDGNTWINQRLMRSRHLYSEPEMSWDGPEALRADPKNLSFGSTQMNYLLGRVRSMPRKRIRLCMHASDNSDLHEMFVVYTDDTYVRANRHPKDESLHIIDGEADFFLFDEWGRVVEKIKLGTIHSDRNFYVRVPAGVWHSLKILTPTITIHEATPGPFIRGETQWAPWAPGEEGAGREWINSL